MFYLDQVWLENLKLKARLQGLLRHEDQIKPQGQKTLYYEGEKILYYMKI